MTGDERQEEIEALFGREGAVVRGVGSICLLGIGEYADEPLHGAQRTMSGSTTSFEVWGAVSVVGGATHSRSVRL